MERLEETLRRLQVECELHEKMKKDLQERNNSLLIEIESLGYVSSQSLLHLKLIEIIKWTPLFSENHRSHWKPAQNPILKYLPPADIFNTFALKAKQSLNQHQQIFSLIGFYIEDVSLVFKLCEILDQ